MSGILIKKRGTSFNVLTSGVSYITKRRRVGALQGGALKGLNSSQQKEN